MPKINHQMKEEENANKKQRMQNEDSVEHLKRNARNANVDKKCYKQMRENVMS